MAENITVASSKSHGPAHRTTDSSRTCSLIHRSSDNPSRASSVVASPTSSASLTSFPFLPPEPSSSNPGTQAIAATLPHPPDRTVSARARDRRATLKHLTSASPIQSGQAALFADSPKAWLDVPGSLHLAKDDHIERLIARAGAVKLVRQFAQDLAQRDAEISALRVQTRAREGALKEMLLQADVSSTEVAQRLAKIDSAERRTNHASDGEGGIFEELDSNTPATMMNQLMNEALLDETGQHRDTRSIEPKSDSQQATIKASDILQRIETRKQQFQTRDFVKDREATQVSQTPQDGTETLSRPASTSSTSSTSSTTFHEDATVTSTAQQDPSTRSSSRRKGLSDIFQPLSQPPVSNSYFIGGSKSKVSRSAPLSGSASIHSERSTRSATSWTTRLFGGSSRSMTSAEQVDGERRRSLSSSARDEVKNVTKSSSITAAESAIAALAKDATRNGTSPTTKGASGAPTGGAVLTKKDTRHENTAKARMVSVAPHDGPEPVKSSKPAQDLGPVEMDAIIPAEAKPPTMVQAHKSGQVDGLLTDRFGFIYDPQQKRKRRDTGASGVIGDQLKELESLGTYRHDSDADDDSPAVASTNEASGKTSPFTRPLTPTSMDELSQTLLDGQTWQDYLKTSRLGRPTELLLHSPSASAIVGVHAADRPGKDTNVRGGRGVSVSIDDQRMLPVAGTAAEPNISLATASSTDLAASNGSYDLLAGIPSTTSRSSTSATSSPTHEQEQPVRLLLERLTVLHDSLQAEKEVRWNDFLRKIRADRSLSTAGPERRSRANNAPEADTVDGELVGVTTLGRRNKANRIKYGQFKSLVLQGIPVSLRPKIWAECSGASFHRTPGHYDDLMACVARGSTEDLDADIVNQIEADVGRTLTDNTFFRHGPGMDRLKKVLLAYSIHNPEVGYCQGMNLITASLLLIMPTSEEVFWMLVAIVENILPAGYFERGLVVSRADQIVLREYVSEVLPRLSHHFETLGVELEACSFMWFLSLFTGCLSAEALYRVWDVVLCLQSVDNSTTTADDNEAVGGSSFSEPATTQSLTDHGNRNHVNTHSSALSSDPCQSDLSLPSPTDSGPHPTTITNTVSVSASPSKDDDDDDNRHHHHYHHNRRHHHDAPDPSAIPASDHPASSQPRHQGTSTTFLFQICLALLKLNEPRLLRLDSAAAVYSYINHHMTSHAISIDGLIAASEGLRKLVRRKDVLVRRRRAVAVIEA